METEYASQWEQVLEASAKTTTWHIMASASDGPRLYRFFCDRQFTRTTTGNRCNYNLSQCVHRDNDDGELRLMIIFTFHGSVPPQGEYYSGEKVWAHTARDCVETQ